MEYEIYKYVNKRNVKLSPPKWWQPPYDINPKKDLTIRPFEVVTIAENGEVPLIVYYADAEKTIKLYEERISYVRDTDGVRTKDLALTQTKELFWYFSQWEEQIDPEGNPVGVQLIDRENTKVLTKKYDDNQVTDSLGHKLPTPEQMREWQRKCENQILYMITNEVAGTPIDQAVFMLLDNLQDVIQKRAKNPISTAFADAIVNKVGGFDIDTGQTDPEGNPILVNIWDIEVDINETLQQFLYLRITGTNLPE